MELAVRFAEEQISTREPVPLEAKALARFAWFMYGLKPVPFN